VHTNATLTTNSSFFLFNLAFFAYNLFLLDTLSDEFVVKFVALVCTIILISLVFKIYINQALFTLAPSLNRKNNSLSDLNWTRVHQNP
jgi:hypothetical protein